MFHVERRFSDLLIIVFCSLALPHMLHAEDPNTRYGLFNLLDHRSRYGQFWFPEAMLAPEMDVDREFRLDWLHTQKTGRQQDVVKGELEYNFGLLTLEAEVPYERERDGSDLSKGVGSIELAARYPVFQYVSPNNYFDYTLAAAMEVAIPSGSQISKDTELVPQLFQLMRFGEHTSLQTSIGYSKLIGPEEGGTETLEYSAVLGYSLEHKDLALPGILRTVPLFELTGEHGLSGADNGINRLFGTVGVRLNLASIGDFQPRLGIGYVFPIDSGAREEMQWGIFTSLVFEF